MLQPGPARAEALSLRALIRYYHGRVPDAVAMGEQALDGGRRRRRSSGRRSSAASRSSSCSSTSNAALGLVDEAVTLLERADGPVDPDLLANALLLRAIAELGARPADSSRRRSSAACG